MAEQKADTPPTEGQGQQSRGNRSSARGSSSTSGSENAQSGSSSSGGAAGGRGQSAGAGDQERQRQVNREPGSSSGSGSGTGMQRGGGQSGAGSSMSTQGQPSMLPAFMANPGLMASAFMSDPFAFAQVMSQEMDRLFDTFGATGQSGRGVSTGRSGRSLQQQGGRGQSHWAPQMEVFKRGNDMVIRADLPGVDPNDVQIDIEDGLLTLSGERRQENEQQQEGFYRSERSYGSFIRTIALPEGVDENQVRARFDHGVLEVDVPMPDQQRSRGRRVQIQSSAGGSQRAGQESPQGAGQSSGSDRSISAEQGSNESGSRSRSGQESGSRSKSGDSAATE